MHEDAGSQFVALLRSELFCANPFELSGHKLEHLVVEGAVVVAGGAGDNGEFASVGINISLRHPGVVVDLRSNDIGQRATGEELGSK